MIPGLALYMWTLKPETARLKNLDTTIKPLLNLMVHFFNLGGAVSSAHRWLSEVVGQPGEATEEYTEELGFITKDKGIRVRFFDADALSFAICHTVTSTN